MLLIPIVACFVLAASWDGTARDSSGSTCRIGTVPQGLFVDVAPAWRQSNYGPSCGWATTISMLRWQGLHKQAEWMRRNRSGGSGPHNIYPALNKLGVHYVSTVDGDERLLEWALATNRGCGLGYTSYHATMLVGRRNGYAVILDNNHVGKYRYVEWNKFVRDWKKCPPAGGWAWAIISDSASPPPQTPML
jgi:hypothetical protein